MNVKLESSWKAALSKEFSKTYFNELTNFVRHSYQKTKVYPPANLIFNALDSCPLSKTCVVILGQDPYHGPNQANGLSFSVNKSVTIPPSLKNIFIELYNDLGIKPASSGCLERWSKQGILLLNTCLTVEKGNPASHRNIGWEQFTDSVLKQLNANKKNIVYLLWGKHAQEKIHIINKSNNKAF